MKKLLLFCALAQGFMSLIVAALYGVRSIFVAGPETLQAPTLMGVGLLCLIAAYWLDPEREAKP